MSSTIQVTTRSGQTEAFNEGAIIGRINELAGTYIGLNALNVDAALVMAELRKMIVAKTIYNGMKTCDIDSLIALCAADLVLEHPDYMLLAGRIMASNNHKQTLPKFSAAMVSLFTALVKEHPNDDIPKYINKSFFDMIRMNAVAIDKMIVDSRDFMYSFTGFNQMKSTYMKKVQGVVFDRPQYMFMRIALALWAPFKARRSDTDRPVYELRRLRVTELEKIREYYDAMSRGLYTHATPTILNSGLSGQLDSCFLMNVDDNIESITKVGADLAVISKAAGGIGLPYSNVRPKGAYIAGTNGRSTGIIPQLKILESHIKAWNQGGTRKGALAIYLADFHRDLLEFIDVRNKSGGDSDAKCPGLFTAIWAHRLFFKRLIEYYEHRVNGRHVEATRVTLPLVDPSVDIGVTELSGADLEIFLKEREGDHGHHAIRVASLAYSIADALAQSGTPFICNADAAEWCSNMKNYGPIQSSNLCTEIFLPATSESYACCTLANVILNHYVRTDDDGEKYFDYDELERVVRLAIRALDRVVTINVYPTVECAKNSADLRPLGLGVQGLADTFSALGFAYHSPEAEEVDKMIFETMYYAAVDESAAMATEMGSYPYFEGSDLSKGIFHWERFEDYFVSEGLDLADRQGDRQTAVSSRKYVHARKDLDWEELRDKMMMGVRNATFLALMPTESTSKIYNNSPCTEPWYQHWFCNESDVNGRTSLINLDVLYKAIEIGEWTPENVSALKATGMFPFKDQHWAAVFRSSYDMKVYPMMYRAHLRQYMVDQGMSLNIRHQVIDEISVLKHIICGYQLGLKTINYYVTRKPVVEAKQVGMNVTSSPSREVQELLDAGRVEEAAEVCSRNNPEACFMCGA